VLLLLLFFLLATALLIFIGVLIVAVLGRVVYCTASVCDTNLSIVLLPCVFRREMHPFEIQEVPS